MNRSGFATVLLVTGAVWAPVAGAAMQSAAATASVPAGAELPFASALDARVLGVTEAVFDFCATNDPVGAAKVRARLKRLVQGASDQALAQVRQSDEYRSARDAELDFVGKVDPHNAHRICVKAAAPGR